MRALSPRFLHDLNPEEGGKYGDLVKRVRRDKDLDLEFRHNYINLYYQGHSVLLLRQNASIEIDRAFTAGGLHKLPESIPDFETYMELLPLLKDNVSCHLKESDEGRRISKNSRELEFEQLLIRANNRETSYSSDYIILDRQYRLPNRRRIDLIALRYASGGRPRGYLSIIEVKYAQNRDIQNIKSQIETYAECFSNHIADIGSEMEMVFAQKLQLGLISRTARRLSWLADREFTIDRSIGSTEILVYLVDYNPKSALFMEHDRPRFPGKIRYAYGGLALWAENLRDFGVD